MTGIKICGITNRADAVYAAECGANAVGFIFHPSSPRYIPPERAKEIIACLPDRIAAVGVFVNRKPDEVKKIVAFCGLDLIQLHGDEPHEYCRLFPPEQVIKAVFLRHAEDLNALHVYDVRAFLADFREAGRYGGTGKRSNWELAAKLAKIRPLILAGGLDATNIEHALRNVAPQAVDINSGCEKKPGIKDHQLLRRIIRSIRRSRDTEPTTIFDVHPMTNRRLRRGEGPPSLPGGDGP